MHLTNINIVEMNHSNELITVKLDSKWTEIQSKKGKKRVANINKIAITI